MPASAFASIRQRLRYQLQDAAGTYWPDDELDDYINDGQLEYVRGSRCLVKQITAAIGGTVEVMAFPTDFLDLIRIVNSSGDDLAKTHWDALRMNFGDNFLETTGVPRHIFGDLSGENQFRLYPNPGGVETYTELGAIVYFEQGEFDTEFGMVIGVDDDEVTFESEEGEVTTINADTVTLYYVRRPTTDLLEVDDGFALEAYALYRAFLKDGDNQNFQKAQNFYGEFLKRVSLGKEKFARTNIGKSYRSKPQLF